jgi:hypothetical protein
MGRQTLALRRRRFRGRRAGRCRRRLRGRPGRLRHRSRRGSGSPGAWLCGGRRGGRSFRPAGSSRTRACCGTAESCGSGTRPRKRTPRESGRTADLVPGHPARGEGGAARAEPEARDAAKFPGRDIKAADVGGAAGLRKNGRAGRFHRRAVARKSPSPCRGRRCPLRRRR